MTYTVREGETLYDISINSVGSMAAVDAIMTAAGAASYSDMVPTGTVLEFDAEVSNNAAVMSASANPFNNNYLPAAVLDGMINRLLRDMEPAGFVVAFGDNVPAMANDTAIAYPNN